MRYLTPSPSYWSALLSAVNHAGQTVGGLIHTTSPINKIYIKFLESQRPPYELGTLRCGLREISDRIMIRIKGNTSAKQPMFELLQAPKCCVDFFFPQSPTAAESGLTLHWRTPRDDLCTRNQCQKHVTVSRRHRLRSHSYLHITRTV